MFNWIKNLFKSKCPYHNHYRDIHNYNDLCTCGHKYYYHTKAYKSVYIPWDYVTDIIECRICQCNRFN